MLEKVSLKHLLFLDIETVPAEPDYDRLSPVMKALWTKKALLLDPEKKSDPRTLYLRAGIYAEFGKIVCISCGAFRAGRFIIKSYYGHDEASLLEEFNRMLQQGFPKEPFMLCGHNAKEFDFPYIARRSLVHGLSLPFMLDIAGKKPWEVRHLDTMELWKFGDWKNYTSLDLLCTIMGIPSPKGDLDGSQVGKTYWEENDLKRIVTYCQRDVLAVAQLILRFQGQAILSEDQVDFMEI